VFPLRTFYTEQMFVLLHTKRMQLRNDADTKSQAFPALKGPCVYIHRIKFRMLEVRENEIALCKFLVVLRNLAVAHLRANTDLRSS